jgi:hypothetical protein
VRQRRIRLKLPRRVTSVRVVYETGVTSADLSAYDEVVLDTRDCQFSEPFPLIYLAFRIRELQERYPHVRWTLDRSQSTFNSYADHIGFFNFTGVCPWATRVGTANPSGNYVPLEVWSIPEIAGASGGRPIGSVVDERSTQLASVLVQEDHGQVFETIQYAIREIFRNALEHSRGRTAVFLAQYWPALNEAEIAVADDGVGIAENLYHNEIVDVANNLGALKVALMPGVSGVSRKDRINQDTVWRNSGFGLYVVSRLAARFGKFCIVSMSDYLELTRGRQVHRNYPHLGAAVSIRIKIDETSRSSDFIRRTIDEGEKSRSEIIENYPINASQASKMLLSDFKKV